MRHLGGRLPDHAYAGFRPFLAGIKAYVDARNEWLRTNVAWAKPLPKIVFDFTAQTDMNAKAVVAGGELLIGLSVGSVILAHDLFFRLLSHPAVLPGVGDPEAERAGRAVYQFYFDSDQLVSALGERGLTLNDLRPRDPVRDLVARGMAALAVDFLVVHELRHVLAGHTSYLEEKYAGAGDRPTMTNQSLEMDADADAFQNGIGRALYLADDSTRCPANWRPIFPAPVDAMRNYLFAIYAFFRYSLGVRLGDQADWKTAAYPPEGVRTVMILGRGGHWPGAVGRADLQAVVGEVNFAVLREAERGISLVTGRAEEWDQIKAAMSPTACEHVVDIYRTWNTILPELRPHSYVELAEAVIECPLSGWRGESP
jgi:hypothetical protein